MNATCRGTPAFLHTLRDKSGLADLDLPTEAQWEFAARAGTTSSTFFGNNVTVNGVEKIVTNDVSTLDVGYASLLKSFVIHGEALFGAYVRDAKIYVELVPVPPAE